MLFYYDFDLYCCYYYHYDCYYVVCLCAPFTNFYVVHLSSGLRGRNSMHVFDIQTALTHIKRDVPHIYLYRGYATRHMYRSSTSERLLLLLLLSLIF